MVKKIIKKRVNNYLFFIELTLLIVISIGIIIIAKNTNINKKSCLSLTFDDGLESDYTIAYPLLKEKNFSATFFIIANITSDPDEINRRFLKPYQIKELSEAGFEIGSHSLSHKMLTTLSNEEIEKELKESKELLEKNYNITINSFAYPYGKYNGDIIKLAKKYYINTRVIQQFHYNQQDVIINSFAMKKDTNINEICESVNYANKNKLWVTVIFHDISQNPKLWDTSIDDFENILNCIQESKIKVGSLIECRIISDTAIKD